MAQLNPLAAGAGPGMALVEYQFVDRTALLALLDGMAAIVSDTPIGVQRAADGSYTVNVQVQFNARTAEAARAALSAFEALVV